MTASSMSAYEITIDGKTYVVEVGDTSTPTVQVIVNGVPKTATITRGKPVGHEAPVKVTAEGPAAQAQPAADVTPAAGNGHVVSAPMPGKVLSVRVTVGGTVKEGDVVCTLEAMKMEMRVTAPHDGVVTQVFVARGDVVERDQQLARRGHVDAVD